MIRARATRRSMTKPRATRTHIWMPSLAPQPAHRRHGWIVNVRRRPLWLRAAYRCGGTCDGGSRRSYPGERLSKPASQKMAATGAMADAYNNLASPARRITSGIANVSNMGLQGQLGATRGLNNVYNNMLQQQAGATQGLGNIYGQMLGQQAGAAQGLNNVYNNMLGQQTNAAQGLQGAYNNMLQQQGMSTDAINDMLNQGLNRAGTVGADGTIALRSAFAPYQQQLNVGSVYDQRNQAQLQDQIKLYNAQQAYPWEQLAGTTQSSAVPAAWAERRSPTRQSGSNLLRSKSCSAAGSPAPAWAARSLALPAPPLAVSAVVCWLVLRGARSCRAIAVVGIRNSPIWLDRSGG